MTNDKRQTTNYKRQTTNDKLQTIERHHVTGILEHRDNDKVHWTSEHHTYNHWYNFHNECMYLQSFRDDNDVL